MAETITMPKLGFDMAEGTLVRWVKAQGENVKKNDVLAEIETDKATVEVQSTYEGVIHRLLVEEGTVVPVGTPIAIIAAPGEVVQEQGTQAEVKKLEVEEKSPIVSGPVSTSSALAAVAAEKRLKASPLARRLAAERSVELQQISGTGPGGRIVRRDVEAAAKEVKQVTAQVQAQIPSAPAKAPKAVEKTVVSVWGAAQAPEDERIPVDRLRAAIGRRMAESKQQVPHFYVTHEYDMQAVMKLRAEINALLLEEQKLSVNDFIVKAVALALRRYPNLNVSLSENVVIRHGHVNVGVAVAVEGGLLTVVSRDADAKPLRVISSEIKEMVARARQGKVRPEDIEGSTFSISNLGMYDVEHFIAIINPPEAAILAIGSVRQVPVVMDGEVKPGTRMKATISADHRVTDGAEAAQFMQALAEYLEHPMLLLL
jgi:pyruvate dehydrogenase E2 component (dihydrolipoamide acetyltransferase)